MATYLTNDKLVIVGAAGMIGSNMVQTALTMRMTPNICLYDVYAPGLEGVAEEMFHCGFEGANPDVKHVVIIFNPADLTGLVTLLYSGLKPSQVTTLAALDSTRLQSALAKKFHVLQSSITGCRTFGGHGEQMAVFGSKVKIGDRTLSDLVGTPEFSNEEWAEMKKAVTKGGAKIIELRGRSSFQSPSYCAVEMIRSVMGGEPFRWPAGTYCNDAKYNHIMMAMDTTMDERGCTYVNPVGTPEEMASLDASYEHLCKMRDELVTLDIVPPISEWSKVNPNL